MKSEMINKENINTKIIIYEPKSKQDINKGINHSPSVSTNDKSKNINEIKANNEEFDIKRKITKYYPDIPGDYELCDKIEKGGESFVMKVKHKKSKIELALKYIREEKKNKKEIKIASQMKHQNIIRFFIYKSSKEDKSEIMIMENGKFGNLRNFMKYFLKRAILSESMLCYFSNEILKALFYCHMNKVAHMDLKPQNIVLDEYMNAKLIDFSISIDYKNKNPKDKIKLPFKGTKPFMPLEVMNQESIEYENINKVDLFELGVMLYYLAFGFFPYDIKYDDDYEKIKEKIKNNKLEIKNEYKFSKYFIDFLEKLLKKDIKERMNIFEAVNHYWYKGGKILYDEKEKTYNIYCFATNLVVDGIKAFNDYLLQ